MTKHPKIICQKRHFKISKELLKYKFDLEDIFKAKIHLTQTGDAWMFHSCNSGMLHMHMLNGLTQ